MSSISRARLFHCFLLKYSDSFQPPVIYRSGRCLSVREGYGRCRFQTVPSNQASLRQHRVASGLPEMRKKPPNMDVGGFFALLAPGFAQGILHLGRYQLAAEKRRLPVDHI